MIVNIFLHLHRKMLLAALLNFLVIHFISTLEVGDNCHPSEDVVDGTCKLITDCGVAIRWIKNKQFNLIQRCGFKEDLEIVCCPKSGNDNTDITKDLGVPNSRFTERIADRECQKIVQTSIPPINLNIIAGDLASLGEFPHMVALGYERDSGLEFECGGSLLSPTYVLTAAHCVNNLDGIEPKVARMGLVELGNQQWNDSYDVRIAEAIKHPDYTRREKYDDLALIRLEKPVEFNSNLNAACLYTSDVEPQFPLQITGWGTTSVRTRAKSNFLLKANVTVVPREECSKSYKNWSKLARGITNQQLCAGDPEGIRDTCQGDSGGPLQGQTSKTDTQYRIIGITSFGRGCGSPVPGVYTRVFHYLDWIESIVWPNNTL